MFAPVAFLMGVPPEDVPTVGELLGIKLVLNEFVAFGPDRRNASGRTGSSRRQGCTRGRTSWRCSP